MDKVVKFQLENQGVKTVRVQTEALGSSGVEIFGGMFSEDYLNTLTGTQRADMFDKMRRSDGRVKMVLSAVKNPIRSTPWEWQPGESDDEESQLHSDFLTHIFFKDSKRKTWKQTLNEALTCVEFGHAVFELTHKVVIGHEEFGDYIGIKNLGWRSPKTLDEWHVDPETGELLSIRQRAHGDVGRDVLMDGEFLSVISLDQEGDLYEGISMLRPCFGAWKRKDVFLKLMAIGIEKDAVKTPVIEVPDGQQATERYTNMVAAIEAYTSHQCAYLTKPEGWNIEFLDSNFDPQKMKTALEFENQEMVFAFLANFLELAGGGGGSYALSNDLSDFFLGGLTYISDTIAETFEKIGRDLIIMKYGPQKKYPTLSAPGIADKIGQEFGVLMKSLFEGKYITPDDKLEGSIRKRMGLPEMSEEGRREFNSAAPSPEGGAPEPEPEPEDIELNKPIEGIQLASTPPKQHIKDESAVILSTMTEHMTLIRDNLMKRIESEYKKASESQKQKITSKLNKEPIKGLNKYKSAVLSDLTSTANQSIDRAKEEVQTEEDIRLTSTFMGIKYADGKLPPKLNNRVKNQSDLLAETSSSDLQKVVFFAYGDSLQSTGDIEVILNDIKEASDKVIEGGAIKTAAANVASRIVNESRNELFFDPEVKETIHSFTFVNSSPISPICQDLAGTVFDADDPEAKRFYPPLHHNCKSTLKANLKRKNGTGPELKEGGLRPSSPKLEKFITLTE